jgi:hypothetical protein
MVSPRIDEKGLSMRTNTAALAITLLLTSTAYTAAQTQTSPGAGNAAATALAQKSPLIKTALERLSNQISTIKNTYLREQTQDALFNPDTCIVHRANLTETTKQSILAQLLAAGLYNTTDAANFPGGAEAGVFPPVLHDGTACPKLPQGFGVAPGSTNNGHQAYPGGLAVHESFNLSSALSFQQNYQLNYGLTDASGYPEVAPLPPFGNLEQAAKGTLALNTDFLTAAPLWHDWAKPIVFQWNADGTEFDEFDFGGAGSTDDYGATGDSRTGGHHIISLAESMARKLPPFFIITQASAHSAPTLGDEFKVVNWLRAAAIIAQVDPVARGYLYTDTNGNLRLPPVRTTDTVDLNGNGQTNILLEYEIHNLSDADFVLTIPAITESQVILQTLAPSFGFDPINATATYTTKFRNPALTFLSGERILSLYISGGLSAVKAELQVLKSHNVF